MKLSLSNIAWPAEWDEAVYEQMVRLGYEGLEIAPTKIFSDTPYEDLGVVSKWYNDISSRFVISSMQSILYGVSESIFAGEEERSKLLNYLKKAVDFAQVLSCKNLVFGCPRNRNYSLGKLDIAAYFFKQIGDYAASKGTCIGMEPVPVSYNTDFLNSTKETIEFIKRVNSDGFKLNLDLGALIFNEEKLTVLNGNVGIINHVHISEPGLKTIVERPIHANLCNLLVDYGYKGFISIEMGKQNSINDIVDTMIYVSRVFK